MFIHCNARIRTRETLFLKDNDKFENRMLKLAVCPICGHRLARLIETRITDGQKFDRLFTRHKADKILRECKEDIEYSSLDNPPLKGGLYGFRYGENKEKYDKRTKETVITQKACDFWGNKETVKSFKAGQE